MRVQFLCGALAISTLLISSVKLAVADDNVVVDLSVLDQLAPASAPIISDQPLFPVVKAKKHIAKKVAPAKVKVKVKESAPSVIKIPARPQADSEHNIFEDVVVAAPIAEVVSEPALKPEAIAPVVAVEGAPVVDTIAPVVPTATVTETPTAVTTIAPIDTTIAPVLSTAPTTPTEAVVASLPAVPAVNEEEIVVVDIEPVASTAPMQTSAPVSTTAPVEPTLGQPTLLIDSEITRDEVKRPDASRQIKFEADRDDLSSDQQIQIDRIVASFKDAINNKIAIFAYNLDDGVDAFRKKRLSLNRAVEIRSYLLQKGYKNFSIKVINVDANSGKANVVEIEEM